MTFNKILIPIALSPSCAWAAHYGAQLARRFGSELVFLHVGKCSVDTIEAFLGTDLPRSVKDTPHEVAIHQGDAADTIVQFVRERAPSLIVMPTHAHGRFRRFLMGSVTAKVLHDVDCPVLTGVHLEKLPLSVQDEFHQVVCAVDLDESLGPVIRGALDFSGQLNAKLTVIHAIPAADETSDNPGEAEVRKFLFRLAEEKYAQLQRETGVAVPLSLSGGAVATVVREAALRAHADLVIIGRGHTQRALGRLRTHAYSIIRSSPCPVLSI